MNKTTASTYLADDSKERSAAGPQTITERPVLLTVAEAVATLRVSKWTIYQLIRSRQLDTVQIGRRRLIPLTAIQDLMNRSHSEGTT